MKAVFDDPQFSFQMLRMLGSAAGGGAEIGECLSTAYRIKEGDFESWYSEWSRTARRVHKIGDECLARGHEVSAREAYARASNYYRVAEFYLHANPNDPRIKDLSEKAQACFGEVVRLSPLDLTPIEIPYEGTVLPGYFYRANGSGAPKTTLIVQEGFDGTQEECYGTGAAANSRGINCITFEGPGQGRVIREQGLPFRPDWEAVVTPVVEHVLSLPDVDKDKVAIMGLSFGGYMAPRACAFEHRLAACIANGGVFDFMAGKMPPGVTRKQMAEWIEGDPASMDKVMRENMEKDVGMKWAVENGMYTFKASSPSEWYLKAMEYTLEGIADKVACPTLVIDTEDEQFFPGAAKQLYDALTCPKTFVLFTEEEGAEDHCQVGSPLLSGQKIFDWLQETLA
jgi:alpha-beta hydrolase superfamily lysophospholipase